MRLADSVARWPRWPAPSHDVKHR